MNSSKANMAKHAADAANNKEVNTKYANASYSWQTFLIDFYRRVKQYYNFDFDSFMIMIVTVSHITHENYKDDPGLDGTYVDFIKGFKDVNQDHCQKENLGLMQFQIFLKCQKKPQEEKLKNLSNKDYYQNQKLMVSFYQKLLLKNIFHLLIKQLKI